MADAADDRVVQDDQVVLPALLRARGSYRRSVINQLIAAGFDDLPRDGAYVLGGMANHAQPASGLVRELGITKQAASQLIDTLVIRGYLERSTDPVDRRRINITLTERGRAAASAVRSGVVAIDQELEAMLTPDQLAGLRTGLIALCEIRENMEMAPYAL